MKFRFVKFISAAVFLFTFLNTSFAQAAPGTLKGQVTDPSGAVVIQASVAAVSSTGQTTSAVTNRQGTYEIKGLAPGKYTVRATAKGFSDFQEVDLTVSAGEAQQFDIRLELPVQK